ncbi:hypothetical protein DM01DRAFT_1215027 [Hesseltinella vesiculosa]|uniref:Zinc knuckle domain-containing protein n=1 Tax=Hesseltinella vesiculosa TaxID=101127 RepID=A0A1X2G282_9FUNG|nr:hypothetical protein DM01DRAFT_1215027 [Hesseltinella vesiculosa]
MDVPRPPPIGANKHLLQSWFLVLINVPIPTLQALTNDEARFAEDHLLTPQQTMILLTAVRKYRQGLRECTACGSPHHATSRSRQCPFHVPPDHPILATTSTDRETLAEIRNLQQQGDLQRQAAARNPHPPEFCNTCGLPGHSRASHPACPMRAMSKLQYMSSRLPGNEEYTRVRSLDSIVRTPFRHHLLAAINEKSAYVRRTMT